MRGDSILMTRPDPGPTGNGQPHRVSSYVDMAAQFHLTGAADVSVQMSLEKTPTNWVAVPNMTNIQVSNVVVPFPLHDVQWLRLVVTAAMPAGDTVHIAGKNSRTDGN